MARLDTWVRTGSIEYDIVPDYDNLLDTLTAHGSDPGTLAPLAFVTRMTLPSSA